MLKRYIQDLQKENKASWDILVIVSVGIILIITASFLGVFEGFAKWSIENDSFFLGEIFISLVIISFSLIAFSIRRYRDLKNEIYERKRAESKMMETTTQLKAVMDGIPDIILQVDQELRILWANKEALKKNPDVKYKHAHKAFSYDEGSFLDASCKWSMELGRIEKNIMYQPDMIGVDGVSYWETIGVPLMNKEANVYGAIGIARDITHRMRLEHTWNLLSSIVESTDDAIFGVSWEGIILNWNKGAEQTYGYSATEIVGKPISILESFELRNETLQIIDRVMRKESIEKIETTRIRKGGKKIIVSSNICPFVDATGKRIGISAIDRDITEAKLSEIALLESEAFNKSIISSAKEGIFVIDKELRFKLWNQSMESITGKKSKDVIGKKPTEILPIINEIETEEVFRSVLGGEIVNARDIEYDMPGQRKKGWLTISYSPHISAAGEIIGVVGAVGEITERKLYEEAIKESETRYKELFDHMSSGVVVYDTSKAPDDLIFHDLNKAAEEIEKVYKRDLIGKNVKAVLEEMRIYGLYEILLKVWKTGDPEYYMVTIREDDGRIISWRQNYIYKIFTGEVVSIFDDITEKKISEDALRESEERYRSFVQNFKGIAFRWSPDYKPIFFHGAVEEITGFTEQDFMEENNKWDDIIHPDDMHKILEQSDKIGIIPGYEEEFEYRIIRKDGDIKWVNEYVQNICDDSGKITYIQATIYNVTMRKVAEEEVKESREQLRHLTVHMETAREEERKSIAFEIHDELGYALTAVKLDLAWLKTKIGKEETYVERLKAMADLVELMINKVRTISFQLRPSILDHFGLSAAIEWQAKEFQKRTSVRCKVDFFPKDIRLEEHLSITVFRIFQEAMTNITRHAEASRVDVSLSKTDTEILLVVKDNGKGITEDQINAKKSLGLVGIREKTNSLGGDVEISGSPGMGTKVLIVVPLRKSEKEND